MNSVLEQLHDIEGLDPISAWPLAIGWWFLIILGACVVCAMAYFIIGKLVFKWSWKGDTLQKLMLLEDNLSDGSAKDTVVMLSEYLRRIVLRQFSRKECASLSGIAWLKWLSQHDPKNFDWEKKGTLLIDVPYAPHRNGLSQSQIKELIQAVREWIR